MSDRYFYFVSLRTLIKTIAWCHMLWSIVFSIAALPVLMGWFKHDYSKIDAMRVNLAIFDVEISMSIGVPLFMDLILNFIFAIYLLKGVKLNRISFLVTWIAYIVFWCSLKAIFVYYATKHPDPNVREGKLLSMARVVLTYGTCVSLVGVLIIDISRESDTKRNGRHVGVIGHYDKLS